MAVPEGEQDASSLAHHLGFVLRRAQMSVFQDFREKTAELDLTPTAYSVLALLDREPGMRVNKLSTLLVLKSANCITLLNELERDGLVAREKLRAPGKAVALSLTAEGKAMLARANPLVDLHLAEFLARLGAEDLAQLRRLLHKLVR